MSTKGNKQTALTKYKISLANTEHKVEEFITAWERYEIVLHEDPKKLPSVVGFCLQVGISQSTILEYISKYPEVANIVEHIFDLQEAFCMEKGITQQVNPIFAMFLLKAKHNFKDSPQQLTQNNYMNISPDVMADALKLMGKAKKD